MNKIFLCIVFSFIIYTGIDAADKATWLMEVAPVLIALPFLLLSYKTFPLTPLLYTLLFIHALILIHGGHFTYAEEPLFNWLKTHFHFARNNYDKVGHLAQGFIPAILIRELLLRKTPLRNGGWLFSITVLCVLGISAAYELIEWGAAEALGQEADAFLGSQGDVFDTQKDMFCAGIGSIVAFIFLSGIHDRQLSGLRAPFKFRR